MSDSVNIYTGQVYGLLGNNNGSPDDDIVSNNGTSAVNLSEEEIYFTMATCKFLSFIIKLY